MLELALLGGFEARLRPGGALDLPTRKSRALLAYLALHPDHAQPRQSLACLLWSDRAEPQAHNSLSKALSALRKALGGTAASTLAVDASSITFVGASAEVDALTFERLVGAGEPADLDRAAALYEGDLLDGMAVRDPVFEDWLGFERERLRALAVNALTGLLDHRGAEGSCEQLVATAQRLLKLDPFQEAAHRALMRGYAGTGQMGLAVRQYQICSEILRRELDVEPSAETKSLMEDLKRARPGTANQTGLEGGRVPETEGAARPLPSMQEKPSIAVLPFLNLGGDPEQEYFSDGLTEDIITALARWRSFPVIARNSSFVYKGKAVDVKQVGRELGAQYVLEGSVRRCGGRVRINAQFIETATGHHVWAERFDRDLEDIFALQDEITERIGATLELALGKAELMRSRAKPPRNLDAWDFCLRGRACLQEWTKDGTAKARQMFERAIELDPNYSEAFADLAWTHARDLLLAFTDDRSGSVQRFFQAARRAVALDNESSRARYRLSNAHQWRQEYDLAIAEGRRAVELNPMDAVARHALGNKLDLAGDPEGIPMMEDAQKLNPQDPQRNMHLAFLARAYVNAGQYESAVECARKAIRRQPDYPNAHYILAIALGHLGDGAGARAALEECERLHPGFARGRAAWRPYLNAASNDHLHEGLRKSGLPT